MSDKVKIVEQSNTAKSHHRHLSPTTDGLLHPPFLPDELIFQILLCLPVKFLVQLKCVSKSWKTLISDPKFAKTHLQSITINNTSSITHQRLFSSRLHGKLAKIVSFGVKPMFENPSKPIDPVEFSMEHRFSIFGSCNGLLCLFDTDEGYVKLWNPSIRYESKNSPTLDSLVSYHGFGYDHVNDKCKVLVVLCYENLTKLYTFGENSWKTIQNFPCQSTRYNGKFVSGTLNWVKKIISSRTSVILSFDLEKETYKEVLLPEHDGVNVHNPVLGVLSNCLCVFFESNKTHWDFQLMKKYGDVDSWIRLMTIPCKPIQEHVQRCPCIVEPLFIFENGIVLLGTTSKFVLYNLNNGNLDCPRIPYGDLSCQHIYHESLVSPQL